MSSAAPFQQPEPVRPLLAGRDRELRLLRGNLAATIAGHGRLVLVSGEAGIGKTGLVAALAREAADQGVLVLYGVCIDLAPTPPYGPWLELSADVRSSLELALLPAIGPVGTGVAMAGRGELFAKVREALLGMATVRPVLVVLEDMHWSDHASLDLLRFIARHLADIPVLVAATYRTDDLGRRSPFFQLLPTLVREAHADRIDLQRLDRAGIQSLIAAHYALPEPEAARLGAYLLAHAEGNLFYTHEVLRTLDAAGILRPGSEGWVLGELAGVSVPPLVRLIVDGRVGRLGNAAGEHLAVAAVIGQEVPLDLWSVVAGVAEDHLLPIVERAIDARLLDASGEGERVRFVHALVREAIYEGVLPMQRRRWHRRVGEVLAGLPGADPDAVAHHFGRAGDRRARAWLVRAGERAQRAYALRTAADRFVAAAGLDEDATGERGWLLYRAGRLLRFVDPGRGIRHLEEAERIALASDDPELAAYALADQGMLRCFGGDLRRGLAEMVAGTEALDVLPTDRAQLGVDRAAWVADALPDAVHARVRDGDLPTTSPVNPRRGSLVVWLAHGGRHTEADVMGASHLASVAAIERPDDAVLSSIADVHAGRGFVAAMQGRPEVARDRFVQARRGHRTIGHYLNVLVDTALELDCVHIPYQTTHLTKRRQLRAELDAVLARVGEVLGGQEFRQLPYALYLIDVLLLEGDWADVQAIADAAKGHPLVQLWRIAAANLAWLARHQGDRPLAWSLVHEELPDGPNTEPGGSQYLPTVALLRVATELALDAGDVSAAHHWLAAHQRWLAWSGAVLGQAEGHILWARCHHATGNPDAARQHAHRALRRAAEPRQPLMQVAAHRLLGEIETMTGRADAAADHLNAALALASACAAPYERAQTLLALAELHAATGAIHDAIAALEEARAICTPLAAALALARADALASRSTVAPAAKGLPMDLSARELQILRLVADGLTDAEIAVRLSISPRTVGQHLRSVYNKLGVPSRAAATRLAVEHDLLA